jgi:photosystem II stability/assembly factor-like uncharacterized protein
VAYQKPLSQLFILRTKDQGDHWEDVSTELRRVASNGTYIINEAIMGITSSEPALATVITSELSLFRTSDGGQAWERLGSLHNNIATNSVVRRLGKKDGERLWSIGGSHSSHSGTRGVFFVQQDEHSWVKYVIGDVFFQDAVSLSQNRFLATGLVGKLTKSQRTYRAKDEAVVLSSVDGGETWGIVYHNPQITSVNCINLVNDSLAWAVGEAGLVIRLENRHKG